MRYILAGICWFQREKHVFHFIFVARSSVFLLKSPFEYFRCSMDIHLTVIDAYLCSLALPVKVCSLQSASIRPADLQTADCLTPRQSAVCRSALVNLQTADCRLPGSQVSLLLLLLLLLLLFPLLLLLEAQCANWR